MKNNLFDMFNALTEEEEQALRELDEAYFKVMMLLLKRQFNVDIKLVDNDHISIDGQVYDSDEFDEWLADKELELEEEYLADFNSSKDHRYDA